MRCATANTSPSAASCSILKKRAFIAATGLRAAALQDQLLPPRQSSANIPSGSGWRSRCEGLFNIQFAIKDDVVYVLEVNPRASRTAPFVSKATGVPLATLRRADRGRQTLAELGFTEEPRVDGFFVKEAVLPFQKFPGVDARLARKCARRAR